MLWKGYTWHELCRGEYLTSIIDGRIFDKYYTGKVLTSVIQGKVCDKYYTEHGAMQGDIFDKCCAGAGI